MSMILHGLSEGGFTKRWGIFRMPLLDRDWTRIIGSGQLGKRLIISILKKTKTKEIKVFCVLLEDENNVIILRHIYIQKSC